MLEYFKKILRKVSFDPMLFRKELRKARSFLKEDEAARLKRWSLKTYGRYYRREIREAFEEAA